MDNLFACLKVAACVTIGSVGFACPLPVHAESTVEVIAAVEGRNNPFLTKKEEKLFIEEGTAIPLDYLQLSAIFYSAEKKKSRTIINGKVLGQGDSVDNKEIVEINPESVKLRDPMGIYVIKLSKVMDTEVFKR